MKSGIFESCLATETEKKAPDGGWEETMPQIEKPDDLQVIANHPVFSYA